MFSSVYNQKGSMTDTLKNEALTSLKKVAKNLLTNKINFCAEEIIKQMIVCNSNFFYGV